MNNGISIDALIPAEMATKAESIGVKKTQLGILTMFLLAILAGAFIALGAIFFTTVLSGGVTIKDVEGAVAFTTGLPYGVNRLIAAMVFCLGLILVVVGGAELFTGNNLIAMAWASGKVSTSAMLRNWFVVYTGNFVGSVGTAGLMFVTGQYTFGSGIVGLTALNIASGKMGYTFIQAIALGIMCNVLVCLAVWMTFSARTVFDKIAAIIFPITAFVAAGFEHSVANMYFIPMGLFIKDFSNEQFWAQIGKTSADYANLTWGGFIIDNLIPVTIGNIIGGALLVAAMYWAIYLRPVEMAQKAAAKGQSESDHAAAD